MGIVRPIALLIAAIASGIAQQHVTPFPIGPLRVEGSRLLDARGRTFTLVGTQFPEFRTRVPDPAAAFGAHSATVMSTIRQRWNMNAVRLPLSAADFAIDPHYLDAASAVVRLANSLELAVILSAPDGGAAFWRATAAYFRSYKTVLFETDRIAEVRAMGAANIVIACDPGGDANAMRQIEPRYQDRELALDGRAPILASGMDPDLAAQSAECAALGDDPAVAEARVRERLEFLDAHGVSWIVSEFRPGKLIGDYTRQFATTLESGWTCGAGQQEGAGIGEVVQFHLWGGEVRGIFAVSAAGNFTIPRNSAAIVYGGIFAEADTSAHGEPTEELGKVSIRITDSAGVERRARLYSVTAGWGQANFVVPAECRTGPATLAIVRRDGSRSTVPVQIADIAPGLWSASGDGRGPAIGERLPENSPVWTCHAGACATVPIRPEPNGVTRVKLYGVGMRYAKIEELRITVGGTPVAAIERGTGAAGVDTLIVGLPATLAGRGEQDLVCRIGGHVSNVVRIRMASK